MGRYNNTAKVSHLLNKVLTSVEVNQEQDVILFTDQTGEKYKMFHYQDCCEHVSVEDITGDLKDLIGTPILVAEGRSEQSENPEDWGGSTTWTFYEFRTVKGSVTIRWYGTSNGYYSESVEFEKLDEKEN